MVAVGHHQIAALDALSRWYDPGVRGVAEDIARQALAHEQSAAFAGLQLEIDDLDSLVAIIDRGQHRRAALSR